MNEVIRIGLDLAKTVFQVHGVNAAEEVTLRRQVRRSQMLAVFGKLPPCLIGIEACGSAHYWARELGKLGHTVRLMPPGYVKPYVRRNKNDAADAAALCEAVSRPTMRFVTAKTPQQQAAAGIHRVRQLLVKQRTAVMNAMRGLMAEFGLVARQGLGGIEQLLAIIDDPGDTTIPDPLQGGLVSLAATVRSLEREIEKADKTLRAWSRDDKTCRHLDTIPGFGPILSTAMVARVPDPDVFQDGRACAASIGVTPRQDSTGGKVKLGPISKRGDGYLRKLLVNAAMAVLRSKRAKQDPWLVKLLASKPLKVAAVALANKLARIAWAVMMRQEDYRPTPIQAA